MDENDLEDLWKDITRDCNRSIAAEMVTNSDDDDYDVQL